MNESSTATTPEDVAFTIERTFDAPRELVWKAWTEAEHLAQWWGPKGFSIRVAKLDVRPGGIFHYCMYNADCPEMWGKFVYHEIVPPEKLVFTNSFSDAEANTTRAPFSDDWPLEMHNTWTFIEQGAKTMLSAKSVPVNATEQQLQTFKDGHSSMQQGFGGTLDQLDEHLARIKA